MLRAVRLVVASGLGHHETRQAPYNPSSPSRLLRRPLRAPVTRGDPGRPHPPSGAPQVAQLRKKTTVVGATPSLDGGLCKSRAACQALAPSPCGDPPEDQRKDVRAKGRTPSEIVNPVQQREYEQEVGEVAARELLHRSGPLPISAGPSRPLPGNGAQHQTAEQ